MLNLDGILDAAIPHGEAVVDRLWFAARTRADQYRYGWRTARDIAQLAGSGATLWLLYRRARAAIPVSISTAAVTAGLTVASACLDEPLPQPDSREPDLRDKVVGVVTDILPNVFGAACTMMPKVRDQLVLPLDLTPRDPAIPFTLGERARNLAALYASYTMVGHWAEMLFCQLIRLGVVGGEYDRSNAMLWDWWLHPFPAEGMAGVLIAGALAPLREHLLKLTAGRVAPALALSFLANQVACTAIDYLTGMVANRNFELWDYRDMPFNFQGQVCLQNSIVYSVAATAVAWIAYPARDRWLRRLPTDVANTGFAALAPIYAFLSLLYFV